MKKFKFDLSDDDSLIILPCLVNNERVALALDTGASHTVIDLTKLLMAGYQLKNNLGTIDFETAKGIVQAYIFEAKVLSALGKTKYNIEICSYDFLGNNILTDIDGVIGLDFFRNMNLNINFKSFEITLK
jgi:gag-polyprotein putative aspartyl protease